MRGDGDVVLTVPLRGQADVAAGLVADLISQPSQSAGQSAARNVAGKSHRAITSSRTWCKRTIFGRSAASGK